MVDLKLIQKNLKTIIGFADSEFLELLIAILHTLLLPMAVWVEIGFKWHIIFTAIAGGLFQFYSVGMRDLKCRYYSTVIATLVAFLTVEQYIMTGKMLEDNPETMFREDLLKRVNEMSAALESAQGKILGLTQKVAELETENRYLQREIDILKRK